MCGARVPRGVTRGVPRGATGCHGVPWGAKGCHGCCALREALWSQLADLQVPNAAAMGAVKWAVQVALQNEFWWSTMLRWICCRNCIVTVILKYS